MDGRARIAAAFAAFLSFILIPIQGAASGTARIQQSDGDVKVYRNVRIAIEGKQMSITSADGVGTIVIERAGCAAVGKLMRCHPYEAALRQRGETLPIAIRDGTAWLNPGSAPEQLPKSSQKLPPRGIVMSVSSQRGTYLTLTGVVDTVKK